MHWWLVAIVVVLVVLIMVYLVTRAADSAAHTMQHKATVGQPRRPVTRLRKPSKPMPTSKPVPTGKQPSKPVARPHKIATRRRPTMLSNPSAPSNPSSRQPTITIPIHTYAIGGTTDGTVFISGTPSQQVAPGDLVGRQIKLTIEGLGVISSTIATSVSAGTNPILAGVIAITTAPGAYPASSYQFAVGGPSDIATIA
jgi:hypothetical protein